MNHPLTCIYDAETTSQNRLEALKKLQSEVKEFCPQCEYVNNHIHTTYSFSPYTPTAAVYAAKKAGLSTAGIMDHDSVGGCGEFLEAGKILSMPVTVGFEYLRGRHTAGRTATQ